MKKFVMKELWNADDADIADCNRFFSFQRTRAKKQIKFIKFVRFVNQGYF